MATPGSTASDTSVPDQPVRSKVGRRHVFVGVLFWVIFGSGLLVQALGPRLTIENNAFVIPPSLVAQGADIPVADIVGKQRRMQWLSLILTVTGALGLSVYYYRGGYFRRGPARARSP